MDNIPSWVYFIALGAYYIYKFTRKPAQAPLPKDLPKEEVLTEIKRADKRVKKQVLEEVQETEENLDLRLGYVTLEELMARDKPLESSITSRHSVIGKTEKLSNKFFEPQKAEPHPFLKNTHNNSEVKNGIIWSLILEPKFKAWSGRG